jgi:hypothetical protein
MASTDGRDTTRDGSRESEFKQRPCDSDCDESDLSLSYPAIKRMREAVPQLLAAGSSQAQRHLSGEAVTVSSYSF